MSNLRVSVSPSYAVCDGEDMLRLRTERNKEDGEGGEDDDEKRRARASGPTISLNIEGRADQPSIRITHQHRLYGKKLIKRC